MPSLEKAIKDEVSKSESINMDDLFKTDSKTIKVKGGATNKHEFKSTLSLDGSAEKGTFKDYEFLKDKKTEVLSMEDVVHLENEANPKEVIRKLVQDAKERRRNMIEEIGGDEHKKKTKAMPVKQKRTLRLTEDKVEIDTKIIKQTAKRGSSAATRKSTSARGSRAATAKAASKKATSTSKGKDTKAKTASVGKQKAPVKK